MTWQNSKLLYGLCMAGIVSSILTFVKAPANFLWIPAIAIGEWGHFAGVFFALLGVVSAVNARGGSLSALSFLASLLLLSPVLRARALASCLPVDLARAFGDVTAQTAPNAPARRSPLSLADLFFGVSSPRVSQTTVAFPSAGGDNLNMDLYKPAHQEGAVPGVIVVHGGSWKSGDRSELAALNRYLAARGYLVASVDYRLAPRYPFPAGRDDVLSAIAYLKSHAAQLNLDAHRLALIGRSAGGEIALSAAYAHRDPAIHGVVAFYTPNDLVFGYSKPSNPLVLNSKKLISDYLGGTLEERPALYQAASPLLDVNAQTPPTLLIHGSNDPLVWPVHSDRLQGRLAELNRPVYYLRLPWATHGCDANFSGPSGQLSTYAIERFLAKVLSAGSEERLARTNRLEGAHV